MYVDAQARMSDAQSVAINDGADAVSTDAYDLKRPGQDVGNGKPLYAVFSVTTALVGPGGQIKCELVSSASDDLSSEQYHATLGEFAALAPVGTTIVAPLPSVEGGVSEMLRYMGFRFKNDSGSNVTAGNVTAFLTTTPQKYKSYPKGYTIS